MSVLAVLLSSGVRAELFRLLFGISQQELHARELERQSGYSISTVRQELKNLLQLGLVKVRQSGNRTYYRSDVNHPLFPEIHGLVLKTNGLAYFLLTRLQNNKIRIAFVFGSVASAAETAYSDVDLMAIGDISLRQIASKLSGVSATLNREVNPHVLTATEFMDRKRSNDHFVSNVLSTPKLFVIGNESDLAALGQELHN